MKKRFLLCIAAMVLAASAQAQPLRLLYQIAPISDTLSVLKLYMESTGNDSLLIRAVNFSFVWPDSCAQLRSAKTVFTSRWTAFVERKLDLPCAPFLYRGEHSLSHRYMYANAGIEGLPGVKPYHAPPAGAGGPPVIELRFSGFCASAIYMETEAENPMNQIGDASLVPMPYRIERIP